MQESYLKIVHASIAEWCNSVNFRPEVLEQCCAIVEKPKSQSAEKLKLASIFQTELESYVEQLLKSAEKRLNAYPLASPPYVATVKDHAHWSLCHTPSVDNDYAHAKENLSTAYQRFEQVLEFPRLKI